MKTERIEYAVIGFSMAGVASALALAESSNGVVLFDFHGDTDTIMDVPRIQATPLAPRSSGLEFSESLNRILAAAGVRREMHSYIERIYSDRHAIVEDSGRRWLCKGVVFAPNGTEPGLEGSSALHGFGVSYSATSDASFFIGQRAAVYGDAPRAIEHAWVAAQYASEVLVLIKDSLSESDEELLADLRSSPSVTFRETVEMRSLQVGEVGLLSAVNFESSGDCHSIDVSALFVAQHVVPILDVVRGGQETDDITFAGLAAGIKYWKHAALVKDGERAARTLLAVRQ